MREFEEYSLTQFFGITYRIMKGYYRGEPVNKQIQELMNII